MAVTYGFYNSIGGDRKYDAVQMSAVFDGIIKDGVFDSIGEIFKVTPGSGLQVVVGSGRAWFDHTWTLNDAKLPLMIEAPDVTLKRYDAVVLEVNAAQATRANSIKVVTGTPGTEPSKPAMANTEEVHQHALAYVLVEPGVQSIAESKIENVVGKSETPFVTAILETVSIDSLFTQWNGQFNDWFENVQSQLEGDVVTNLQRQIDLKVPKSDISSLVANRLVLPNGSEKFGQIAFPTVDKSVLMQNKTGAPAWIDPATAAKELGFGSRILARFSDMPFNAGETKGILIGPYMMDGNEFRSVELILDLIGSNLSQDEAAYGYFTVSFSGVTGSEGIRYTSHGATYLYYGNAFYNKSIPVSKESVKPRGREFRITFIPGSGASNRWLFGIDGLYQLTNTGIAGDTYDYELTPDLDIVTLQDAKNFLANFTIYINVANANSYPISATLKNIRLREL